MGMKQRGVGWKEEEGSGISRLEDPYSRSMQNLATRGATRQKPKSTSIASPSRSHIHVTISHNAQMT
jgi:hypothetical protein